MKPTKREFGKFARFQHAQAVISYAHLFRLVIEINVKT